MEESLINELKKFTLSELREEVKRRERIIRAELKYLRSENRCRNCSYLKEHFLLPSKNNEKGWSVGYMCSCQSRTFKRHEYLRYRVKKPSDKICDNFNERDESKSIEPYIGGLVWKKITEQDE